MALHNIDDKGNVREVLRLDHEEDFNRVWMRISSDAQAAIKTEMNRRLDELVSLTRCNVLFSEQGVSEWTPE